jgi:hypothetical protein
MIAGQQSGAKDNHGTLAELKKKTSGRRNEWQRQ